MFKFLIKLLVLGLLIIAYHGITDIQAHAESGKAWVTNCLISDAIVFL